MDRSPADQTNPTIEEPAFSLIRHASALREGVVRRNMRDLVTDKISALIASGMLQVGDVLPSERDLAAALNVSRMTVRGSIQTLVARDIVEVSQGARTRVISADVGPFVANPRGPRFVNGYDIEAVRAARLLVECGVVAQASMLIDTATLSLLDDLLDAQRRAIDDPVRFLISDREFHFAIYRSCDNPVLSDFVCDLYAHMMEQRRKAVAQPGAIKRSLDDHVVILASLRAHDGEQARRAFEIHIDRIFSTTRDVLRADRSVGRRRSEGKMG